MSRAPAATPYRVATTHPLLASVAPAPRKSSPRARDVVLARPGRDPLAFRVFLTFWLAGAACCAVGFQGLPVDVAIALWGEPTTGIVFGTEVETELSWDGRHPRFLQFRYKDGDREYDAGSYSLSAAVSDAALPGATVSVEMVRGFPGWARVAGTTKSPLGFMCLFAPLIPVLVGWGLPRLGLRLEQRRRLRTFAHGVPRVARVTLAAFDRTSIEGVQPFMVAWQFEVEGNTYTGRIQNVRRLPLRELIVDDSIVIFYDPRQPSISVPWIPDSAHAA